MHTLSALSRFAASTLVALALCEPVFAATLTFVSEIAEPIEDERFDLIEISPDGKTVYAASDTTIGAIRGDAAIAVYDRDLVTGALTFVELEIEGSNGVPALERISHMTFSGDGTSLYALGNNPGVLFARDTGTGELTFVEEYGDGVLLGPAAISPDDRFVYGYGNGSKGVGLITFSRDLGTGALTQVGEDHGFAGVRVAISGDGTHLYMGHTNHPTYGIRVYDRDLVTGELQFRQKVRGAKLTGSASDLPTLDDLVLSHDEAFLFALTQTRSVLAVWSRSSVDGELSLVQQFPEFWCSDVSAPGSMWPESLDVDPAGGRVFSLDPAGSLNVIAIDPATGSFDEIEQLTPASGLGPILTIYSFAISPLGDHAYVGTHERTIAHYDVGASPAPPGRECLHAGKTLSIKSDPLGIKKAAKSLTDSTPYTFVGAAGSDDDPTCNGDPPGTARATVRFRSAASGEDTGEIDLPCEYWSMAGTADNPKRKYKYVDLQRAAGPCKKVIVTGQKAVSIRCDSKGSHPFDYDLTPGVDQGIVEAVLTIGDTRYCVAFDDHKGKDGSDGKKFVGKSSPPPAACP